MEITEQIQHTNMSDDEDELEVLRKAALQTLKKAADKPPNCIHSTLPPLTSKKIFSTSPSAKRGRGFHNSGPTRGLHRNGQFNGRMNRNSNLISIPTMESQTDSKMMEIHKDIASKPKLILPQDRYCGKVTPEVTEKEKVSSKFSRYEDDDDSDDSESDNSEAEASENDGKLKRSSSLDALVQELEFEISGEKPSPNKKSKMKKAKLDLSETASVSDKDVEDDKPVDDDAVELFVDIIEDKIDEDLDLKEDVDKPTSPGKMKNSGVNVKEELTRKQEIVQQVPLKSEDIRRPIRKPPQKGLLPKPQGFNGRPSAPMELNAPRRPNPNAAAFNPRGPCNPPRFHPRYPPQNNLNLYNDVPYMSQHRPIYPIKKPLITLPPYSHQPNNISRPLSPLNLNTEALSTITMAPLSPRSAAFVLQNREIIEKRKRSPRRSYSRSRSPSPMSRLRRSKSRSPRRLLRSPSPRRYPRSTSPKRTSPRSSVAVRRIVRSPMRPRRSRSPIDRSPKRELKERPLNNNRRVERVERHDEAKRRRTASPEAATKDRKDISKVEVEKGVVNPVLEARKKKFEQQNSISKEGIIRLKPKHFDNEVKDEKVEMNDDTHEDRESPEQLSTNETYEDDDALDVDTLETKIDDIFSDDETDEENEGRFKVSSANANKKRIVPVLPFSQIVNGPARDIKNKSLEDTCREQERDRRDVRTRHERTDRLDRQRDRTERERKHRSPLPERKERNERKDDRKEDTITRRVRETERRDDRKDYRPDRKTSVKTRIILRRDRTDDERIAKTERTERVERTSPPVEKKIVDFKMTRHTRKLDDPDHDVSEMKKMKIKERPMMARKVAIATDVKELDETGVQHEHDILTVIDDEEDQKDVIKKNEAGDLRAQLSRKRAERQNHKPAVAAEDVQTRLLHNALGAVFQKSKKTKRNDAETAPKVNEPVKRRALFSCKNVLQERRVKLIYTETCILMEPKDKLPIHQRLGLSKEIDEPTKKKKKSKRSTEQNLEALEHWKAWKHYEKHARSKRFNKYKGKPSKKRNWRNQQNRSRAKYYYYY